MGRKKIQIKAITDEKSRLVTFAKRKNGLFKKAYELSVLCECEIALIVFTRSGRLHQYASTALDHTLMRRDVHPSRMEYSNNEDILKSLKKRAWNSTLSESDGATRKSGTRFLEVLNSDNSTVNMPAARFSKSSAVPTKRRSVPPRSSSVKSRVPQHCVPSSISAMKLASQVVPVYSCVLSTGVPTSGITSRLPTTTYAQDNQKNALVFSDSTSPHHIATSFDESSLSPFSLPTTSASSAYCPFATTGQPQTEYLPTSQRFVPLYDSCIPNVHDLSTPAMILHYAVLERTSAVLGDHQLKKSNTPPADSNRPDDHPADGDTNPTISSGNSCVSERNPAVTPGTNFRVMTSSSPVAPDPIGSAESDASGAIRDPSYTAPSDLRDCTIQSVGLPQPSIVHTNGLTIGMPIVCTSQFMAPDKEVPVSPSPHSSDRRRHPRLSLLNVTPLSSSHDPNTPSYGVPLILLPTPEVESELKSLEASGNCESSLKPSNNSGSSGPIDLSSPVSCSLNPLFDPFSGAVAKNNHSPVYGAVDEPPSKPI